LWSVRYPGLGAITFGHLSGGGVIVVVGVVTVVVGVVVGVVVVVVGVVVVVDDVVVVVGAVDGKVEVVDVTVLVEVLLVVVDGRVTISTTGTIAGPAVTEYTDPKYGGAVNRLWPRDPGSRCTV